MPIVGPGFSPAGEVIVRHEGEKVWPMKWFCRISEPSGLKPGRTCSGDYVVIPDAS